MTLGLIDEVQIRVYSAMKTVADCFKYADKIGSEVGPSAPGTAVANNKYNRQRLLCFAEICRVKQAVAAAEKARRKTAPVAPSTDGEADRAAVQRRVWDSETLAREVWETPVRQLATKYGVSDNGVRKHCKRMGIALPSRGSSRSLRAMIVMVARHLRLGIQCSRTPAAAYSMNRIKRLYLTHRIFLTLSDKSYKVVLYGIAYAVVREELIMEQIVRTANQLGSFIQRRRRALSLTQKQLAATIGVRQSTISELETSARETRTGTLLSILAALDLELVVRPRSKGSIQDLEAAF